MRTASILWLLGLCTLASGSTLCVHPSVGYRHAAIIHSLTLDHHACLCLTVSFTLDACTDARQTNQIDIYSPTIESFQVGVDASYGDTTHIYNAYLGNDGQGIGIRIAENMSESTIISPRLDHIATPLINNSPTTMVLYWDSPGDPPSQCALPPQCFGNRSHHSGERPGKQPQTRIMR